MLSCKIIILKKDTFVLDNNKSNQGDVKLYSDFSELERPSLDKYKLLARVKGHTILVSRRVQLSDLLRVKTCQFFRFNSHGTHYIVSVDKQIKEIVAKLNTSSYDFIFVNQLTGESFGGYWRDGYETENQLTEEELRNCLNGNQLTNNFYDFPENGMEQFLKFYDPLVGPIIKLQDLSSSVGFCYKMIGDTVAFESASNRLKFDLFTYGKGLDQEKTLFSCYGEFFERWASEEVFSKEREFWASSSDLKDRGAQLLEPQILLQYSEQQIATREKINQNLVLRRMHQLCPPVPHKYNNEKLKWVKGKRLTDGSDIFIPSDYLYRSQKMNPKYFSWFSSNGLAAGWSYRQAFMQGLCELIERDSTGIWWFQKIPLTAVEDDVEMPFLTDLKIKLKNTGRVLKVFNLTTDLEVPVLVACSWVKDTGGHILTGFGCHFNVKIALERSLCELVQSISVFESNDSNIRSYSIQDLPFISGNGDSVYLSSMKDFCGSLDELATTKLDVSIFNHTLKRAPLKVVRVISTELCHKYPLFGYRRLFEIPQKVFGKQPLAEAQLNQELM